MGRDAAGMFLGMAVLVLPIANMGLHVYMLDMLTRVPLLLSLERHRLTQINRFHAAREQTSNLLDRLLTVRNLGFAGHHVCCDQEGAKDDSQTNHFLNKRWTG